jgi:hypothetical protein
MSKKPQSWFSSPRHDASANFRVAADAPQIAKTDVGLAAPKMRRSLVMEFVACPIFRRSVGRRAVQSPTSENPKIRTRHVGQISALDHDLFRRGVLNMKAPSGSRGSLQGLAGILAQAPRVAAAFGRWPGFVLMMTTILALFAVSLVTAIVLGKTALNLFG